MSFWGEYICNGITKFIISWAGKTSANKISCFNFYVQKQPTIYNKYSPIDFFLIRLCAALMATIESMPPSFQ